MGRKTSVYLSDDLAERWRASGLPLSELVRRGLDAGEQGLEAKVGRLVLDAVASAGLSSHGSGHTATVRHTAVSRDTASGRDTAPDTATSEKRPASQEAPRREREPEREKCPHPPARVLKGQCRVCGEYVGKR